MMQIPYRLEVVSDPTLLEGLKMQWDGLYARQPSAYLSDSFDWASLSWAWVTSHRRRRLHCVVVRRGARVVALWPLVLTPGALLRVASPMNSEASEYCPCLLDPNEAPGAIWTAIHQGLASRKDVDALRLPHVRPDTALQDLIGGLPELRATVVQPAPLVRASDFADADQYAQQRPAPTRATLRRGRRKLQEMGRVEFEDVSAPEERTATLRWLLAQKQAWLEHRGLANARLLSERNVSFLEATVLHPWRLGDRRVFALTVGGRIVAAEVVSVDRHRVESFHSAFDSTFSAGSPGHQLTLEIIRWALARRLDYDFRQGSEAYKLRWSSRVIPVASYLLPLTFRGRQFVRYRLARRWISERTPRSLREQISSLGT